MSYGDDLLLPSGVSSFFIYPYTAALLGVANLRSLAALVSNGVDPVRDPIPMGSADV